MSLNVLHTIASLQRRSGGPSRSVTGLCNSLGRREVGVFLLSMDGPDQQVTGCIEPDHTVVKHFSVRGRVVPLLKTSYPANHLKVVNGLHRVNPLQIIHNHGMWLPCNHASAVAAYRLGVPHVISPRGMLEPWAMNFKAWKKKLAWKLWVGCDLKKATAFCATAQQEAENLRQLGLRQPIAIIPNGVDLLPLPPVPEPSGKHLRQALFLSRVHPKKGVRELVEAWARLRPSGWELIIAGPDEGGHSAEVRRVIAKHGLDASVRLIGSVEGEAKRQLYRRSDLFVLPTFSENFGIVVAEALAMGTPVITTKGAPWAGLVHHNCGWWIDTGVEPLVQALRDATALSDETRCAMGARGRILVGESFSWKTIALNMEMFYLWLLGKGDKPDCVYGN